MQFDPNNRIVKLCAEGMQLEALGKNQEAHALFTDAWTLADTDLEKFTAAHYLARNQEDGLERLHWNQAALVCAEKIKDESVKGHYPSLYLNIAKSYEDLGDKHSAEENYKMAAKFSSYLPDGGYGSLIKSGIGEGLKRIGVVKFSHPVVDQLINKWCALKDLKPLSLLLPAYITNLGTDEDTNRFISALSMLSAAKCLDEEDQKKVDGLITEVSSSLLMPSGK